MTVKFRAHHFHDVNQGINFFFLNNSGNLWPASGSGGTLTPVLQIANADVTLAVMPRAFESTIFASLVNVYQFFKLNRVVYSLKCMNQPATAGLTAANFTNTRAATATSKECSWSCFPAGLAGTSGNPLINGTYAGFIDIAGRREYSKYSDIKLIIYPRVLKYQLKWQTGSLTTDQFDYDYEWQGKRSMSPNNYGTPTYGGLFCFQATQNSSTAIGYSCQTDYYFTAYGPF